MGKINIPMDNVVIGSNTIAGTFEIEYTLN